MTKFGDDEAAIDKEHPTKYATVCDRAFCELRLCNYKGRKESQNKHGMFQNAFTCFRTAFILYTPARLIIN